MMENQLHVVPDTVAVEDVSICTPVTPQSEPTQKSEAEQEAIDLGPFVGSGKHDLTPASRSINLPVRKRLRSVEACDSDSENPLAVVSKSSSSFRLQRGGWSHKKRKQLLTEALTNTVRVADEESKVASKDLMNEINCYLSQAYGEILIRQSLG